MYTHIPKILSLFTTNLNYIHVMCVGVCVVQIGSGKKRKVFFGFPCVRSNIFRFEFVITFLPCAFVFVYITVLQTIDKILSQI